MSSVDFIHFHLNTLMQLKAVGYRDLTPYRSIILEYGWDDLICWDKGCYLGQELMARVKHTGKISKKPILLAIFSSAGKAKVGEIISSDAIDLPINKSILEEQKIKNLFQINDRYHDLLLDLATKYHRQEIFNTLHSLKGEKYDCYLALGIGDQDIVIN